MKLSEGLDDKLWDVIKDVAYSHNGRNADKIVFTLSPDLQYRSQKANSEYCTEMQCKITCYRKRQYSDEYDTMYSSFSLLVPIGFFDSYWNKLFDNFITSKYSVISLLDEENEVITSASYIFNGSESYWNLDKNNYQFIQKLFEKTFIPLFCKRHKITNYEIKTSYNWTSEITLSLVFN